MEVERYLDTIARRLRAWRGAQGLTLQQVAGRSGVAASTIQKVESKQMVPTIAVLFKITRGLGRNPAELIDDCDDTCEVVHQQSDPTTGVAPSAVPLTGRISEARLSSWRIVQEPGERLDVPEDISPHSELLIICERGRLDATVREKTFTLRPGDSLHCKARSGLGWRVVGDEPAGLTVVGFDVAGLDRLLVLQGD